jgi:large subunit ribosomal protein L18
MLNEGKLTKVKRERRALRVRAPIRKKEVLRLSVFRSAKHISAQIINDQSHVTIVGVGSYEKEFRNIKDRKEVAKQVGLMLAKIAKEKEIVRIVFDRGSYKYHGRLAALADGAREGGLLF